MRENRLNNDKKLFFQTALIFAWLAVLKDSDAYYSPYLIMGLAGIVFAVLRNSKTQRFFSGEKRSVRIFGVLLSVLFSLAVAAANYSLFTEPLISSSLGEITGAVYGIVLLLICLAGGYTVCGSILSFLCECGENEASNLFGTERKGSSVRIFFITAVIIAAIDCCVLFLGKYPGLLTEDSISQIDQLMSGTYSNHHPYYHTMIIKLCMKLGFAVFKNYNAAVAVYCVFQIIVVACTFGYAVSTLNRMGLSTKYILICILWYALLPCHILYSITVWKDILFGATVTVFLITAFRILKGIGSCSIPTWILLVVSGIGACLLRTNGWITFFAAFPFFCLLFFKKNRKLCGAFLGILAVSFILKNPVLDAIGVSRTDTIESLSIPAQQIARVIKECKDDLTDEQREALDKIVDVNHVYLWYSEFISNPVKDLVRLTGDQEYLRSHMKDYLRYYIEIGLAHPKQYFEAWVEETKGYWNSGYDYWIVSDMVSENSYGITRTVRSPLIASLTDQYVNLFGGSELLRPLQSIGFYVWIMIFLAYAAFVQGRKEAGFLFIPLIIYVASLLAATPVFAEFRYTYLIFCIFPFLVFSPFYKGES
ncbi:MAG: DUF6020 family protein [Eubacteriales bacterium]|nr:DUF6020 family protein [Eubacteriales bacterium]